MDETKVETEVMEQPAQTPASNPPPATTPTPDIEALKAAAKEEARREAQSAKDREIANLHRQYQEREAALRTKARQRLARHDENDAAQLDSELANETLLSEARAIVHRDTAERESRQTANEIAEIYGLKGNDPRLAYAASWEDFRAKAKAAAADDARKEREAVKQAELERERKKVDARVDSGELSGLELKPTGAVKQTEESLVAQLTELQRSPTKNFAKIQKLLKEMEALGQ